MNFSKKDLPKLGCGVGLRAKHYTHILENWPREVEWFEAISENYMDSGGRPLAILEKIRSHYPVALHGVALSIGSTDPLNQNYLARLNNLIQRIQPVIVSDHLCWSGAGGAQLHDLLPLPFTEEAIRHVADRVSQVQDFLNRPILLENVSMYVTFKHSVMPEWEFLSEVAKRSGCGILLDINNIYVNSKNHGFHPYDYLEGIPAEKIGQFHLAGHTDKGTYLFDTHSRPTAEPVWDLYCEAIRRWGQIATLVEWDEDIPEWAELMQECAKAREIALSSAKMCGGVPAMTTSPSLRAQRSNPEGRKKDFIPAAASSKSLQEIQSLIKEYIQPAGKRAQEEFLNPQGDVSGEKRLSVYAEGYVGRVYEGLKEVYEAVYLLVGHERFADFSEEYAKRYSSQHYNLSLIGSYVPELIRQFPLPSMPYLEDLARLEWLIAESFHAFEDEPMNQSQLAKISPEQWEQAKIIFQPSVFLMASSWPVLEIWKDRQTFSENTPVSPKPQKILIGRRGLQVRCEILDEMQHRLLQGLMEGCTLGEMCEVLADLSSNESMPIADWFARWVTDGLIARCEIPSKTAVTS